MYRIVLACSGVPADVGPVAARDIAEEFTHRPWHKNVCCHWDGSRLFCKPTMTSIQTVALLDEFSDAIAATIKDGFDGDLDVVSVEPLSPD